MFVIGSLICQVGKEKRERQAVQEMGEGTGKLLRAREKGKRGNFPLFLAGYASVVTVFFRTPMPSISTLTTSPAFKVVVVPGVPVKIRFLDSSVITCEIKLTITGTGKIRSAVVCD